MRRRRLLISILVAPIVAFVALIAWRNRTLPPMPIVPSRATTYILGPVNPDGTINYLAAFNEIASEGVTRENNAAIPILEVLGPEIIAEGVRAQTLKTLGLSSLPAGGDYFVYLDEYPRAQDEDLDEAVKAPWKAEEQPGIAAWREANAGQLDKLVEASRRPRYYMPWMTAGSPHMMSALLKHLSPTRNAANALKCRAMLRLGSGDLDGACRDALALHRLARLVSQPPALLPQLVGIVMEKKAGDVDAALAGDENLTAARARRMISDLRSLPPMPEIRKAFDTGERFALLDAMMAFFCEEPPPDPAEIDTELAGLKNSLDPDLMFGITNSYFGEIVAALEKDDYLARRQALDELPDILPQMEAIKARYAGPSGAWNRLWDRPEKRRAAASKMVAFVTLAVSLPVMTRVIDKAAASETYFRLTIISFALAAHRIEQGRYPAELSGLVPEYLPEIPGDVFSGKPLVYRLEGEGYVLYSIGANLLDDGGVEEEDIDEGDIVVRQIGRALKE